MTSALACALTAAALFAIPAQPAGHHHDRDRDRCEKHCQRSGDGDRKGNRYCFMPCDFVIIVPMPGQDQQPGPDEQAALFPPNPEKLVQAIQAGAAGIGKAAGDLAGAAAAMPIAILL